MVADFLHTIIVGETKTICLTGILWSLDLTTNIGVVAVYKSQCVESNINKSRIQWLLNISWFWQGGTII